MSETNYFRLIEAYFDGTIKPEQKLMLESKIETDPLLKAEFNLQQNIINGIGEVRRQQLKARLSSIDVSGSGSMLFGSGVKWLAGTLTAVTLVSLLYWYTADPSQNKLDLNSEDMLLWKTEAFTLEPPVATTKPVKETETIFSKVKQEVEKNRVATSSYESEAGSKVATNSDKSAKAKPQELVTFKDDSDFQPYKDKDFSKSVERDINRNVSAETEIEFLPGIEAAENYHYRYFNNKLYLYGEFENEPYEIIELHNNGRKQLFLSYQDDIYRIHNNITNVTPLEKVEDEMLIIELKLIIDEEK